MRSGGTPPTSNATYYGGDISWVTIADMTKSEKFIYSTMRNLSVLGLENSNACMYPAGTVLYAMYASLGECSIAGVMLCSHQAILGIRPSKNLHNEFLYYYLSLIKNHIKQMGQQSTQINMNKEMVEAIQIPLPPLAEQNAIVAVLADIDTEIAALERRRDKAQKIKTGMMQNLLTGKIRL